MDNGNKGKGGKGKIHLHPNAGKGDFRTNPQNIKPRAGLRYTTRFFLENYKEVEGVSKEEYVKVLGRLINMTEKDWNDIYNNQEFAAWIRLLVADLMNPSTRPKIMTDLTDRLFGKAKEEFVFSGEVAQTVTALDRPIQIIVNGKVK